MPGVDPAATILALRPASAGFEVLVVRRNSRGFFGDLVVFPGGRVDDIDVPDGHELVDDLPHRNAALREFAEETGILITEDGSRRAPPMRDHAFYNWIEEEGVTPGVDNLTLVSRWITPEAAPRRFDTRFYVVSLVDAPEVEIDADELIWHRWAKPQVALDRYDRGEWAMFQPTIAHLKWLQRRNSIEDAIRSAEGADGRTAILPQRVEDGSLLPVLMPAELP